MAIGTTAAIIGASALAAGATTLASSKAAKATKNASETNNALQSQIYQQNAATLAPFVAQGAGANTAIGALLGLPSAASAATTAPALGQQPQAPSAPSDATLQGFMATIGPKRTRQFQQYFAANPNLTNEQKAAFLLSIAHKNEARTYQSLLSAQPVEQAAPQPALGGQVDASPYETAFDNYRKSTGYEFRVGEGEKAVLSGLGARGYLESGAAQKSLLKYGQGVASDEFGRYLGALTGQQAVGLNAASAQAGVGSTYANATSANNNAAANASGNAALATANGISSALGSGLSAYSFNQALGSSYGTPPIAPPPQWSY